MHTATDALMNEASDLIAELRGERDRLRSQLAAADLQIISLDRINDELVKALANLVKHCGEIYMEEDLQSAAYTEARTALALADGQKE